MNEKELIRWQKKVINYAQTMIDKYDREIAAARVWRWFGTPTEVKNDLLIIWFGKTRVEL